MVDSAPAVSAADRRSPAPGSVSPKSGEEVAEPPQLDLLDRRLAAPARDRRIAASRVDRRPAASRVGRRQVTMLRGLGVLFVGGALVVTAAAQALVASDQQRIDGLQVRLAQTIVEQQNLQLSRAELESPLRVLQIAEGQLGMLAPGSESFLAPVNPAPSVEQARAAAEGVSRTAVKARVDKVVQRGVSTTTAPVRIPAGSHSIASLTK